MPRTTETPLNDAMQDFSLQITAQIAEADKRAKAAERKVQSLEKRLAIEQSKRRDKVTATRKDARGLARKSDKLETQIEELKQELDAQQDEKLRLEYRSQVLIDQVRRLSEDHHASTELFEHALQELGRRQKSVREITHKHKQTRAELEARLDALEQELQTRSQELKDSRDACAQATTDLKAAGRREDQLQQASNALGAKIAAAEAAREELAGELAAARAREAEQKKQLAALETACERDRNMLTRLREELQAERLARESIETREQQTRIDLEEEIASLQKKIGLWHRTTTIFTKQSRQRNNAARSAPTTSQTP